MKPRFDRFFPGDISRDVDDELTSHLEMRERDLRARGVEAEAARALAQRQFGDVDRIARACRDIDRASHHQARRASMWMDLRKDLTFALRLLARSPGFTAVAVTTLALGIGAPTAIFSLANWVLLRPIPGVERPHEVQQVWGGVRRGPNSMTMSGLSYPNLLDIAPRLESIELAGRQATTVNVAKPGAMAEPLPVEFVNAGYFDVLGVRFAEGRPFSVAEDNPAGAEHVAVVSHTFAQQLRGGGGTPLGATLTINGLSFTIVGITAKDFQGTERFSAPALWLPGGSYPAVNRFRMRYDDRTAGGFLYLLGRLKPGATWEQADAELKAATVWLRERFPKENAKFERTGLHLMGPIGQQPLGGYAETRRTVMLMFGVAALVLLIACSNIASLLLMRGLRRTGEVAVRQALGAARFRIVRQHLTEAIVLWLLGGAGGLLLVWTVFNLVDAGLLLGVRGATGPVPLDARVVLFSIVLSLVVGLLVPLVPALRAAGTDAAGTLKGEGPGLTPRHLRVGSALTALQLATSLTLVVGALLLTATIRQLSKVDVGFDARNVYAFSIRPAALGYTPEAAAIYRDEFSHRLLQVAGVERVATVMYGAPFVSGTLGTRVRPEGAEAFTEAQAAELISPEYFDTLRIPLLAGRLFTAADLGFDGGAARRVVVVSEQLARALFDSIDVVGRAIELRHLPTADRRFEIIGVVGNIRTDTLTGEIEPLFYKPAAVPGPVRAEATYLVRTSGPADVASAAARIAAELNGALPLGRVLSMQEAIGRTRALSDGMARLMTCLALVAALLAGVGLYGVVAFGVAARRREFGIRLALGAPPAQVMALVLRRTAVITAAGVVGGAMGAVALSRMLQKYLFGVTPFDPLVWTAAALLLIALALLASWIPARRAARVEVTSALRAL